MILLIDNYDSFANNLARYFRRLGQETRVVRNDRISVADTMELQPDLVVLSPGPNRPAEAGICLDLVKALPEDVPIFGVCLGHQVIGEALGARVIRCEPCHGRSSQVIHDGSELFRDIPSPCSAGRYHSLAIDRNTLPDELSVTAWTACDTVMGVSHRKRRVAGVQFHPESVLTPHGYRLLANVARWAGLDVPECIPTFDAECASPRHVARPKLDAPLTF